MGGYVTYVAGFHPNQHKSYSVLKIEWPATTFFIPANPNADPGAGDPNVGLIHINDEAIPWCEDAGEIASKAFLFRVDATSNLDGIGAYYLFQDPDDMICWSGFNGGNPSFENRAIVGKFYGVYVRPLAAGLGVVADPRAVGVTQL
jgi:hypothetical protein